MSFFKNRKVDITEEAVKDYDGSGGKWLNTSGIYEVLIKRVIVDTSDKGSEFLNMWVEYEGQEQMLYQVIRLTNNDGSLNKIGNDAFWKFCAVCGAEQGATLNEPVSEDLPVGKEGKSTECMVLEDFNDIPMFLRLQLEYSLYEGRIQETRTVRNFFRYEDKATAAEIINNVEEKGTQYEKELAHADAITYREGVTAEDVQEWIKNGRNKGKGTTDKKPSAGFGGKRAFGKK